MLAAQDKAGKTTLRDNCIRLKVDGDAFLDSAAVTPIVGGLVLVDAEMGSAQPAVRLVAGATDTGDRSRLDRRAPWSSAVSICSTPTFGGSG